MSAQAGEATAERLAVISYHSSPLVEPGAGDSGGMTIYVRKLAETFAGRGLRTDIFTRTGESSTRISQLSPGVRVIGIKAGPAGSLDKGLLLPYVDEFAAGVADFAARTGVKYDLLHSHYWQSGLAARLLSGTWQIPFVHSHHTLGRVKNHHLPQGDAPEPQTRLDGEAEVIAEADVLVTSTDHEWEQLSCLYGAPHDRLKTVHPGVDHDMFSPGDKGAARAELVLGNDVVLLYAGRIQPLKGLDLAIKAIDQLLPAFDGRLVFLVVGGASGEGGEADVGRLGSLVHDLGLDAHVRFLGPQPHSSLPLFYRAADALVVCSHYESFGLAALEAHACGTPVVATAVGGLSHIVRDWNSGFLVDTRDPEVFAGRLETLLADSDLRVSFGNEARRQAERFSWERTADSLIDLYDCLVRERWPQLCTC
jgi:D-inositol-3-phosphate glycosyltransferase